MDFNLNININASPTLLEVARLFAGAKIVQPALGETLTVASAPASETLSPPATTTTTKARKATAAQVAPVENKEDLKTEKVEVKDENTTSDEVVTVELARAVAQEKAQNGKRDGVKALLNKFGASSVTALPETAIAEFINDVRAL